MSDSDYSAYNLPTLINRPFSPSSSSSDSDEDEGPPALMPKVCSSSSESDSDDSPPVKNPRRPPVRRPHAVLFHQRHAQNFYRYASLLKKMFPKDGHRILTLVEDYGNVPTPENYPVYSHFLQKKALHVEMAILIRYNNSGAILNTLDEIARIST